MWKFQLQQNKCGGFSANHQGGFGKCLDLGTGKFGVCCSSAGRQPRVCCLPLPFSLLFPSWLMHPQDVDFCSCASSFLFALPKDEQLPQDEPHEQLLCGGIMDGLMLPLASPSAQNSCCQSTRLHKKLSQCHKEPEPTSIYIFQYHCRDQTKYRQGETHPQCEHCAGQMETIKSQQEKELI